MLKSLLIALSLAPIASASAQRVPDPVELPETIRCVYEVTRPGKTPFIMSGHLIADDAVGAQTSATYLTLQPPTVTGIKIDARVLITIHDYNPMKLHPRGDTVRAVAAGQIKGDRQEISFTDAEGNSYRLGCMKL